MLQMPRIPQPKGFRFENVEAHQLRQQLAAEIRETIMVLIKSTYIASYADTLYKYADVITPGDVRDHARLPVPSARPNDMRDSRTNIAVVYARLSYLIQLFWDTCLDGTDNATEIRRHLMDLRAIASYGIDRCRRVGNPREGYWLEVA